ncbi:MAG: hypothetical protein J2O47_10035 [Acidimicrobiaceae bacterium]|nr:hypothetical protein [Acidimicrobiaceae bacterium]
MTVVVGTAAVETLEGLEESVNLGERDDRPVLAMESTARPSLVRVAMLTWPPIVLWRTAVSIRLATSRSRRRASPSKAAGWSEASMSRPSREMVGRGAKRAAGYQTGVAGIGAHRGSPMSLPTPPPPRPCRS